MTNEQVNQEEKEEKNQSKFETLLAEFDAQIDSMSKIPDGLSLMRAQFDMTSNVIKAELSGLKQTVDALRLEYKNVLTERDSLLEERNRLNQGVEDYNVDADPYFADETADSEFNMDEPLSDEDSFFNPSKLMDGNTIERQNKYEESIDVEGLVLKTAETEIEKRSVEEQ